LKGSYQVAYRLWQPSNGEFYVSKQVLKFEKAKKQMPIMKASLLFYQQVGSSTSKIQAKVVVGNPVLTLNSELVALILGSQLV
jgi:hypothetical protein